jgi:hypothetical protein
VNTPKESDLPPLRCPILPLFRGCSPPSGTERVRPPKDTSLLEDAGAVIDIDLVDQGGTSTPHELLQLAAAALDAIPADERPVLLAPARAELQSTIAASSPV